MRTVRQLLDSKPADVHSIAPDAPVIDALRLMAERHIGAVVVCHARQLAGIVSERDYARKVILQGRASSDTPVHEIMTADVVTVSPTATVAQCMQLMTDHRIRHLPVVVDGDVVGIVSIGDLVRAVIEDQQLELDQLQRYIQQ